MHGVVPGEEGATERSEQRQLESVGSAEPLIVVSPRRVDGIGHRYDTRRRYLSAPTPQFVDVDGWRVDDEARPDG